MNEQKFKAQAQELGIFLTDKMIEQFEHYYNKLIAYNEKVNLTAITEKEDVFVKHFLDSIVTANLLKENAFVCDIGSGAEFPSLPLKIVRPDLKVTMVDSLNKRIIFLKELIVELGLTNIEAVHSRAEDYIKEHRESYDYLVARAVAGLNTLSEYCIPFVKIGGYFLAYKSTNITEELEEAKNAIKILGGVVKSVKEIKLPQTDIVRSIVIIEKQAVTPKLYPRNKNNPKIRPL